MESTRQIFAVLCDRAVGVARITPRSRSGALELLIHRSLAQDDGRGLFGPAIDESTGRLRLLLFWGDASPHALGWLHEQVLAMQAPLLTLWLPPPHPAASTAELSSSLAASSSGASAEDAASAQRMLAAFGAHRRTRLSPVNTETPWPFVIWPRPLLRNNDTGRILLRIQRPCSAGGCGDGSVMAVLRALFVPPFRRLAGISEVGLTGGPLSAVAPAPKLTEAASNTPASDFDEVFGALEVRAFDCTAGGEAPIPQRSEHDEAGLAVRHGALLIGGSGVGSNSDAGGSSAVALQRGLGTAPTTMLLWLAMAQPGVVMALLWRRSCTRRGRTRRRA